MKRKYGRTCGCSNKTFISQIIKINTIETILGSKKPQFMWGKGKGAVLLDYCNLGDPYLAPLPTHSYNTIRHSSFIRNAATKTTLHLFCEKRPYLNTLDEYA